MLSTIPPVFDDFASPTLPPFPMSSRISSPKSTLSQLVFSHLILPLIPILLLISTLQYYRLRAFMPPGPKGLPWIGNQHQVPAIKPWKKFKEWNDLYGSVVSIILGSTPVIVLGKAEHAWELLEKRSDIYSSRPRFIVAGEILSTNFRGLMLPNTHPSWRKWRKVLHMGFHYKQAQTYKEIQSLESNILLWDILQTPQNWEGHMQRFAASVVVSVSYGRRIDSVDEWVVRENIAAMDYMTSVLIPGKYLVEAWPWLLKLPRRLQWFRREPELRRQRDIAFLMHLYNEVKSRMKSNGGAEHPAESNAPDCLTAQAIEMRDAMGLSELEVAYAVSSPFGAGIETTAGTLASLIMAMLHFPDVQKAAQKVLDDTIGPGRMPEFEDRESLPYITALVNETIRWRPVPALGGTPHAVSADDVYNGMFIPKGSTVFANFYGIMKDPELFPSPEKFDPSRFLTTTNPRLKDFGLPFGFGRRVCPGMHLARNSLFITTTRLLWAFDILPPLDKQGKEYLPDSTNYTNGFNSRPVKFDCRFVPRKDNTRKIIEDESNAAKGRLDAWR